MPRREFNLTDLDGVNGFTINGIAAADTSGRSVAIADVNGDGFGDIIVGASGVDHGGQSRVGAVHVVFGHAGGWPTNLSLSSLNGTNGFTLYGESDGDGAGYLVSPAGDMNHDNISDFLINTNYADTFGLNSAGITYLIFGNDGVFESHTNLSSINGTNGVRLLGVNANDKSGSSIASVGDVNDDEIDDILIGASGVDVHGGDNSGVSYLVFGHNGTWPANLSFSELNGSNGCVFEAIDADDLLGFSVSSAGDFNDDGINDLLIGAGHADITPVSMSNIGREGESYVVFGHRNPWPAIFPLSTLNGSNGFVLQGADVNQRMGQYLDGGGDINGDGYSDLLINSPGFVGDTALGSIYAVFGRAGTWPINNSVSSLNGNNGFMLYDMNINSLNTGRSFPTMGDVNNDGIDDVLIGSLYADPGGRNDAGETYVVFGHRDVWPVNISLRTLNGANGLVIPGLNIGDISGIGVYARGDINGDGADDVIIGAKNANAYAGQSYVIFGGAEQFSANQMEIQSGEMIRLNQTNLAVDPIIGNRTFTVTNTSHINFVSTYNTSATLSNFTQQQINDGEVLVIHDGSRETPSYTVSAEGITRVFSDVYPQSANVSFSIGSPRVSVPHREFNLSDLNGVNGFTINGIAAGDQSGYSVSSAGDINGDGISDAIIGALEADPDGRNNAGQSYLLFGHNDTWTAGLELSALNDTSGVIINGVAVNDVSGYPVASAGDVNGDGIGDVLIGAHGADPAAQSLAGQSYLVFGHTTAWSASLELFSLNSTMGVIISGIAAGDHSGWSLASAGDVNDDGFDDVIIGAYGADLGGRVDVGQSYLLFGHNGTWPANLNLSSINGSIGVVINGIAAGDSSGHLVATAGDVNGDGIDDVFIGAYQADPGGRARAGQSYLVFGNNGVWPANLELSSLNGSMGVIIDGIAENDESGLTFTSAGDVNFDGFNDVIIGAYVTSPDGGYELGQGYLLFGHNGTWPAELELSSLNGINGVIINGIVDDGFPGFHPANVGDVNGDGIDDVIIGIFNADPGGRRGAGQSYLLFGHTGAWPAVFELSSLNSTAGVIINGVASGDSSGVSVAFAGDINGDGSDDVVIGGYGANPGGRVNAGQSYIIFGGAEQFNANEIEIGRNETLALNASNIEINPNIGSRMINVTDVSRGHFALASNTPIAINSFNQSQINNGNIVFVHDGSDQAPRYVVSAQGITRVFSNVHPQVANVSFVMSDAPTSAPTITPTAMPTIAPIATPTRAPTTAPTVAPSALPTFLPTVVLIAVPTIAPTTVPSLNPTSFFGVPTDVPTIAPVSVPTSAPTVAPFSLSPTALINGVETADNGSGGSDSSGLIIGVMGGVIGVLALVVAGFLYQRHKNNKRSRHVAESVQGTRHTVEMTTNPMFVSGANRPSTGDSYLDVAGEEPGVAPYDTTEVALQQRGLVLDGSNYVADPTATYASPPVVASTSGGTAASSQYSVFRSSETTEGGTTPNADGAYHVFRSPSATSSAS